MPRKPNLEIRLRCNKCKEYTQTINPIIIKKKQGIDFTSKLCSVCNKYKNKYLNIEQVNLLPDEIKHAPDNTTFTDNIIKEGNALPLLTLIPAIFAWISALTSIAGNKQTEAQGGAIPVERVMPIERTITGLHTQTGPNGTTRAFSTFPGLEVLSDREKPLERTLSDDELINKSIEFLTGKGFSVSI